MSYVKMRACMLAIIGLMLHIPSKAESSITVGNAPGEISAVNGPSAARVDLGACKFFINLSPGQAASFNDPDLIIYYSAISKNGEAYLSQEPSNSGESWGFEKNGSARDRWMGFMCESLENFSKLSPGSSDSQLKDSTPALDDIRQSNDLKCPATLTKEKWIPRPTLKKGEDYLFKEISGDGWSGFVVGYKASKKSKEMISIRFCAINGGHVLMGATENGYESLTLPINFFYELFKSLETIKFPDK